MKNIALPVVGWCGDEMEVRAGLTYLKAVGQVVGCVDGPISEKNVGAIDKQALPTKFATHIMMVHVVSTDGKIALPLIHYATRGATGEWMAEKVY